MTRFVFADSRGASGRHGVRPRRLPVVFEVDGKDLVERNGWPAAGHGGRLDRCGDRDAAAAAARHRSDHRGQPLPAPGPMRFGSNGRLYFAEGNLTLGGNRIGEYDGWRGG